MNIREMSDKRLLFEYASLINQIDMLYKTKKEMEEEMKNRYTRMIDNSRKGKVIFNNANE